MRLRQVLFIISCLMLCILFYGVNTVSAQNEYVLSITDTDYALIKKDISHEILTYNIMITLHNSGSINSANMTIILVDEDLNVTQKCIIPAGESKIITFEDHPLIGLNDHTIQIKYRPTVLAEPLTNNNNGETTIFIKYSENGKDNGTPGFEVLLVFMAIALYSYWRKKTTL